MLLVSLTAKAYCFVLFCFAFYQVLLKGTRAVVQAAFLIFSILNQSLSLCGMKSERHVGGVRLGSDSTRLAGIWEAAPR